MLSDFQDFEALVKVFLPLFDLRFGCLGSFGFLIFVDAHARHNQARSSDDTRYWRRAVPTPRTVTTVTS